MTCIIAVEAVDNNGNDVVVMAGDHLGSNGFTKNIVTQPKVFSHSGIVFGYTTSFRFGQLIEHCLDNNELMLPPKENTYKWLVKQFVPELKSILKDNDYTSGGNALVGINGQLWEIQNDFSVLKHDIGFGSVGSGTYHTEAAILTWSKLELNGKKPNVSEVEVMLDHVFETVSTFVTSVSSKYSYVVL